MSRFTTETKNLIRGGGLFLILLVVFLNGSNEKKEKLQKQYEMDLKMEIFSCKLVDLERRLNFEEQKDWLTKTQAQTLRQESIDGRLFCQQRLAHLMDQGGMKVLDRILGN